LNLRTLDFWGAARRLGSLGLFALAASFSGGAFRLRLLCFQRTALLLTGLTSGFLGRTLLPLHSFPVLADGLLALAHAFRRALRFRLWLPGDRFRLLPRCLLARCFHLLPRRGFALLALGFGVALHLGSALLLGGGFPLAPANRFLLSRGVLLLRRRLRLRTFHFTPAFAASRWPRSVRGALRRLAGVWLLFRGFGGFDHPRIGDRRRASRGWLCLGFLRRVIWRCLGPLPAHRFICLARVRRGGRHRSGHHRSGRRGASRRGSSRRGSGRLGSRLRSDFGRLPFAAIPV